MVTLVRMHRIVALHGPDRGRYHCPAGITKRLAGFKIRMFAYDAIAPDFLHLAVRIGNQPMTLEQLCRYFADIGDSNGVGKDIAIFIRGRLRFYEMRSGLN